MSVFFFFFNLLIYAENNKITFFKSQWEYIIYMMRNSLLLLARNINTSNPWKAVLKEGAIAKISLYESVDFLKKLFNLFQNTCFSLCSISKFLYSLFTTGKILIIGGGIANFTNVAATFKVYMSSSWVFFFLKIYCLFTV